MKFPDWGEAPKELLEIDGHCGLLAAWTVLRYFGKSTKVPKLVKTCRYTKRYGVFTVSLATCLLEHGLYVSFHSDPDSDIGEFERRGYVHARRLGLQMGSALDLPTLLRERRRGRVPIVIYSTPYDAGHFSPLLSLHSGVLRLPLANGGTMSRTNSSPDGQLPGFYDRLSLRVPDTLGAVPEHAKPPVFLLDTMSFIFRAYHAMQRSRPMSTRSGLPTAATYVFVNMIKKAAPGLRAEIFRRGL